ncbi:MAG: hypothetical protein J0L72_12130 [Armatimonadetes bacterium]|nr:hypothetical protein [Armatimonadota bacterium]
MSNLLRTSLISAVSVFLTAAAFGQANSDEHDPLPGNLQRGGVNISNVWACNYRYSLGQPTYNIKRAKVMLDYGDPGHTWHDFDRIASGTNGLRFGHIRIAIDPVAFGADHGSPECNLSDWSWTGWCNTNNNGWQTVKPSENFKELARDIIEAKARGLDVIIDLHPIYVSEYDFHKQWYNQSATSWPRGGLYVEDLCTAQSILPIHTGESVHPLPRFWKSFVYNLRTKLDYMYQNFFPNLCVSTEEDPYYPLKGVHFEILIEPFVNFFAGGGPRYTVGISGNHQFSDYKLWRYNMLPIWKELQKSAISAIYSEADPNYCRVIATTYNSLFDSYDVVKDPTPGSTDTYQFEPFKGDDFPGGMDYARRVVYAYHPYLPFYFTHPHVASSYYIENRYYYKPRDFENSFDNAIAPRYKDNVLKDDPTPGEDPPQTYVVVNNWRKNYDAPMIATELGARTDGTAGNDFGVDSNGAEPIGYGPRAGFWTQRDFYHHDMRTQLAKDNSGWTMFDYIGKWGAMTNRYLDWFKADSTAHPPYDDIPDLFVRGARNPGGELDYKMVEALFGDNRPSEPNPDE